MKKKILLLLLIIPLQTTECWGSDSLAEWFSKKLFTGKKKETPAQTAKLTIIVGNLEEKIKNIKEGINDDFKLLQDELKTEGATKYSNSLEKFKSLISKNWEKNIVNTKEIALQIAKNKKMSTYQEIRLKYSLAKKNFKKAQKIRDYTNKVLESHRKMATTFMHKKASTKPAPKPPYKPKPKKRKKKKVKPKKKIQEEEEEEEEDVDEDEDEPQWRIIAKANRKLLELFIKAKPFKDESLNEEIVTLREKGKNFHIEWKVKKQIDKTKLNDFLSEIKKLEKKINKK